MTGPEYLVVRGARPKRCSKSHIALLLSNTHLRQFYYLNIFLSDFISFVPTLYLST